MRPQKANSSRRLSSAFGALFCHCLRHHSQRQTVAKSVANRVLLSCGNQTPVKHRRRLSRASPKLNKKSPGAPKCQKGRLQVAFVPCCLLFCVCCAPTNSHNCHSPLLVCGFSPLPLLLFGHLFWADLFYCQLNFASPSLLQSAAVCLPPKLAATTIAAPKLVPPPAPCARRLESSLLAAQTAVEKGEKDEKGKKQGPKTQPQTSCGPFSHVPPRRHAPSLKKVPHGPRPHKLIAP